MRTQFKPTLRDKFPSDASRRSRLEELGVEIVSIPGDAQKSMKNGDKNSEANPTRLTNSHSHDHTTEDTMQTQTNSSTAANTAPQPQMSPEERVFNSVDQIANSVEKLAAAAGAFGKVQDNRKYAAIGIGAASGTLVGGTAGGLIMAFAAPNPTAGTVLGGVAVGGGVGGMTGAGIGAWFSSRK